MYTILGVLSRDVNSVAIELAHIFDLVCEDAFDESELHKFTIKSRDTDGSFTVFSNYDRIAGLIEYPDYVDFPVLLQGRKIPHNEVLKEKFESLSEPRIVKLFDSNVPISMALDGTMQGIVTDYHYPKRNDLASKGMLQPPWPMDDNLRKAVEALCARALPCDPYDGDALRPLLALEHLVPHPAPAHVLFAGKRATAVEAARRLLSWRRAAVNPVRGQHESDELYQARVDDIDDPYY